MSTTFEYDAMNSLALNVPDVMDGGRTFRITAVEARSWVEALEPLLTDDDRELDSALLDGYERAANLEQEAVRLREQLLPEIPVWGSTLGLYQWARELQNECLTSNGNTLARGAIVLGILERIAVW